MQSLFVPLIRYLKSLLSATVILLFLSFYPTFHPSLCWYSRERIEGPHSVLAATAATPAMQRAGGMGNTDRQQSDSRASAEGKGTTCIKKSVGTAGPETGRPT